jgi:hypothetical protein
MVAGGVRFRTGLLMSLLGSNGVQTADGDRLMLDAHRMAEAYDWIRRLTVERGLLPLNEIIHPRSQTRAILQRQPSIGFGWLGDFSSLTSAVLRDYLFLPFPRGPSLEPGERPSIPLKGSGWCMPWSGSSSEDMVSVLRVIHTPAAIRAVNGYTFPFCAVRSSWDSQAVRRRYPLYRHAAGLIDGTTAVRSMVPHMARLDLTFRNASAFTRAYRHYFGHPPSSEGKVKAGETGTGE